jgi:SSS family solute:Na+ symporter
VLLGLCGVRGVAMNPQEYIVAGRRVGALLLWRLLAGEMHTTFTFLGARDTVAARG